MLAMPHRCSAGRTGIIPATPLTPMLVWRHVMQTGKDAGEAPVFVREYSSPLSSDPRFDVVRAASCQLNKLNLLVPPGRM